jgi:large subunit ribosomal protein L21
MNKDIAVIKTGGKQYIIFPGHELQIEKIEGKPNTKISFNQILLFVSDKRIKIGNPIVNNAKVEAVLLETKKVKKVKVFKFKAKKRYKKSIGHRQNKTKIKIEKIIIK